MSVFVLDQLTSGPMANIMSNFEITSNIIVCQLEQQSKITAQRVTLATGPIEQLFEKHFGRWCIGDAGNLILLRSGSKHGTEVRLLTEGVDGPTEPGAPVDGERR